jgi:hypothetical protein
MLSQMTAVFKKQFTLIQENGILKKKHLEEGEPMIAISPLQITQLYQTNNETYKISAIQRISATSKNSASSRHLVPAFTNRSNDKLQEQPIKNEGLNQPGLNNTKHYQPNCSSLKSAQLQAYLPAPMNGGLLDLWV